MPVTSVLRFWTCEGQYLQRGFEHLHADQTGGPFFLYYTEQDQL